MRLASLSYPTDFQTVTITLDGSSEYNVTAPLAVCAVHYVLTDGSLRRLEHEPLFDREFETPPDGFPTKFSVYINQDTTVDEITFRFNRIATSGTILVDVVPYPKTLVAETPAAGEASEVHYPLGFEERIVLGMARRALAREETVNPAIESQINDADEHINNAAYRRLLGDNARVRKVRLPTDSADWIMF